MTTSSEPTKSCPCGSGQTYAACCGLYIDQGAIPQTAEQLMRSRYCAYVLQHEPYLLRTWHASTRPHTLGLHAGAPVKWLGLRILVSAAPASDNEAQVEFVARYTVNGKAQRLQENSRFVREAGRWFYVDGVLR